MSRTLLQSFAGDENYIFHIILDPFYISEFQFLSNLVKMFGIRPNSRSTLDYKEEIKNYLFKKGVDEKKTVVLLIDEGQKLTSNFLEILRTLLNYETNEYKILQLILMSQMELLPRLVRLKNFWDRIALKYVINPLERDEVKELINYRLSLAGYNLQNSLFGDDAISEIHNHTQGYPRKIAMLCHDSLETIVMKEQPTVEAEIIREMVMQKQEV